MSDKQKVYLYSIGDEGLLFLEGYIDHKRRYYGGNRLPFCIDGRFKSMCGRKSGYMYNGHVWLPERDDELARKILMEYENARIKDLERQIESHKKKIKILNESPL